MRPYPVFVYHVGERNSFICKLKDEHPVLHVTQLELGTLHYRHYFTTQITSVKVIVLPYGITALFEYSGHVCRTTRSKIEEIFVGCCGRIIPFKASFLELHTFNICYVAKWQYPNLCAILVTTNVQSRLLMARTSCRPAVFSPFSHFPTRSQ